MLMKYHIQIYNINMYSTSERCFVEFSDCLKGFVIINNKLLQPHLIITMVTKSTKNKTSYISVLVLLLSNIVSLNFLG